nr:MAG TPA: hypothetical protein [Caudoviricetes sp.]
MVKIKENRIWAPFFNPVLRGTLSSGVKPAVYP